jgi:hypothetical protein
LVVPIRRLSVFLLFSSDASPRYKRNVLDTVCYPEGHIFRLRYHRIHVAQTIRDAGKGDWELAYKVFRSGRRGLAVYAETSADGGFTFYPLRTVEILRIRVTGSIYYVDVHLREFVDYGNDRDARQETQAALHKAIQGLASYPLPQLKKDGSARRGLTWRASQPGEPDPTAPELFEALPQTDQDTAHQGYFLTLTDNSRLGGACPKHADSTASWESVVDVLARSDSLKDCTFYLIEGFHEVRRTFWLHTERLLPSTDDGWASIYPLPMGQVAVLKLLFYRPEGGTDALLSRSIVVRTEGDVFSGTSHKAIAVTSRYNEERLLFACKRVFDSTLASIYLEPAFEKTTGDGPRAEGAIASEEVLAPRPFLLVRVTVPVGTVALILLGLVAAPILLTAGSDFYRDLGHYLKAHGHPDLGDILATCATHWAAFSKAVAAVVTLVAGYFGFRRLPVGK